MGVTIDRLHGRVAVYVTCDSCGLPILDRVGVDPPEGCRDYDRHYHADGCPTDDTQPIPETDRDNGGHPC